MCNIGMPDRILRFITGMALVSLVFIGPESLWGWIGILPITTAIVSYCPLYSAIGYNGCKK